MTDAELNRFRQLTRGTVDNERLEDFLLTLLPPHLAAKVQLAIDATYKVMPDEIKEPVAVLAERVNQKRKAATQEDSANGADDTQDPSPSPSGSDDSGDGSKEPDDDDEDDSNGLPIIGDIHEGQN